MLYVTFFLAGKMSPIENSVKTTKTTTRQKICILGSTGSIGVSTLDVISRHPDKFSVECLTAYSKVDEILKQCQQFKPKSVVMVNQDAATQLMAKLVLANLEEIEVSSGEQALVDAAQAEAIDTVMAAIVGFAGLMPTLAAIKASKKVLLANKEALVTSGQIFIDALKNSNAQLLPIDSEHNAIFQCLPHTEQQRLGFCQLSDAGVSKILLTGSGGPFRTLPVNELENVSPEQACAHPNWDMGRKISVDSATMMNKGLEFIEAKWLFNLQPDDIKIVLHPQSTIHSMVQYRDGSVIAQMGDPDMRTPIAHALAFPQRIDSGVAPLDFFNTTAFEFESVDFVKYPNLKLAIDACYLGQAACTALNAANEIAVAAFLDKQIKFTEIAKINETSMNKFVSEKVISIDDVVNLDKQVRNFASSLITDSQ